MSTRRVLIKSSPFQMKLIKLVHHELNISIFSYPWKVKGLADVSILF